MTKAQLQERIKELEYEIEVLKKRYDPFRPLRTGKEIAKFMGFSERTFHKYKPGLIACNAISMERSGNRGNHNHWVGIPYLIMLYYRERFRVQNERAAKKKALKEKQKMEKLNGIT